MGYCRKEVSVKLYARCLLFIPHSTEFGLWSNGSQMCAFQRYPNFMHKTLALIVAKETEHLWGLTLNGSSFGWRKFWEIKHTSDGLWQHSRGGDALDSSSSVSQAIQNSQKKEKAHPTQIYSLCVSLCFLLAMRQIASSSTCSCQQGICLTLYPGSAETRTIGWNLQDCEPKQVTFPSGSFRQVFWSELCKCKQ